MGRLEHFNFGNKRLVGDVFIETGTFHGESLLVAARAGFKHCYSIELSPINLAIAKENLKCFPEVQILLGRSPEILPQIINPALATTFWLDAHFQGRIDHPDESDSVGGQCPLNDELLIILKAPWVVLPIIMIDDANMFADVFDENTRVDFVSGKFDIKQWPRLKELKKLFQPGQWLITEKNNIIYCLPKSFMD